MTREQLNKHWDVIKAFKDGKEIQFRKIGEKLWEDPIGVANFEFYLHYEYREKPEDPKPTKRLPTIEEVKKWFMENRVFFFKQSKAYIRIVTFTEHPSDNSEEYICLANGSWFSIVEFCKLCTHYDGSELYITENEKNIYRSVDNAKGDDSICSIIYAIKEKIPYGGEIADFPIEVVERMLEYQVEQGNNRDVSVFERNKRTGVYGKGFDWEKTKEGDYFWEKVIANKNFDLFFKKYPKKQ